MINDKFTLNGKTKKYECQCGWSRSARFPIGLDDLANVSVILSKQHPVCGDGELDVDTAAFNEGLT